jgi:general secretion pathway protein G
MRHREIRHRKADGFTLIELLLVLVILGILAGIVIPSFKDRGRQARITSTFTQIANFKTALSCYEAENGKFPPGRNGLQDLVVQPRDLQSWRGPYMESIPDDPWKHPYLYACPGKHNPNSYDIISLGPDEQLGTADDIANWTPPGSVK